MSDPSMDAEDAKLITLARSARARVNAAEGAAVRDGDGRTYAAANVSLPTMQLSALQLAIASAVSAGATELEAAAVVSEGAPLDETGRAAMRDLSAGGIIHLADPEGRVLTAELA